MKWIGHTMRSQILVELSDSEAGVTSIEYALISSLIAIVILGAVTAVGRENLVLWTLISKCVTYAVSNAGSCT